VFENWVLREYLNLREEEAGPWRGLQSEEFHNLYTSPNIIKGKGKVVPVL
jgi:hypothetical protein